MKELHVVAAIIRYGDKVLIAQRKSDSPLAPDLWEFPGGKVRFGEKPEDAIIREIGEELGLEVRVIGPYAENVHDYETAEGTVRIRLDCWECEGDSDKFELRDVQDARVVGLERLLHDFEFAPADVPIVERLAAR